MYQRILRVVFVFSLYAVLLCYYSVHDLLLYIRTLPQVSSQAFGLSFSLPHAHGLHGIMHLTGNYTQRNAIFRTI
jgi:hypothetical protein